MKLANSSRDVSTTSGPVIDLVPLVTTFAAIVLSCLPFGSWIGIGEAPAFVLIAVVFWGLARPAGLSLTSVFVAGLLFDFLSAGPPGLWALVYLLVYLALTAQNRVNLEMPLIVHWVVCLFAAIGAGFLAWSIGSFYYGTILPLSPLMAHLGMAVVLYPIFAMMGRILPRPVSDGD